MDNIQVVGKRCTGCGGCADVCPVGCIAFTADGEGFLYPTAAQAACIRCGRCVRRCAERTDTKRAEPRRTLAAKYTDTAAVRQSASGGAFLPLAEWVLDKKGVVFGCALDEHAVARHIAVERAADLPRLQGSKYVQSDTRGIFRQVREALEAGRYVLFSGTGCQAAGLRAFLGGAFDRLFIVDLVCHGVPSPWLFEKYRQWLGTRLGAPLDAFAFRSKEKSGWDLVCRADAGGKTRYRHALLDPYMHAFLKGTVYRACCYGCRYANTRRPGDVTLGDCWGIEKLAKGFADRNGVSLVLLNTAKGEAIWDAVAGRVQTRDIDLRLATAWNRNLAEPSARPSGRDTAYEGLEGDAAAFFEKKLAPGLQLGTRLKRRIPAFLKRTVKWVVRR